MKIGVIGSTGHVGYVFESLRKGADASVVGIAPGSVGERMEAVRAQCEACGNSPEPFPEYRRMLDVCLPDCVVVACHFGDHARIAVDLMERRIPAFVEKPLATTLGDLAKLKAARARQGGVLMPMLALRYASAFYTAWRTIRAGSIGVVRLLTAQKSYKLGERAEFYKSRTSYGGTIPWVGSHAMDWVFWLSGKKPVSVYASHSRAFNRGHGDLETSALCQFLLEDEVMAGISIDYLRPASAPTHADDRVRAVGTRGVLEVREGKVLLLPEDSGVEESLPLEAPGLIFDDFLAFAGGQRQALCSHEDGFLVTEASLLARQSADEGREIAFG